MEIEARNEGYLGTFGLASAKALAFDSQVYFACNTTEGASVRPEHARVCLGHLDGWGRGRHGEMTRRPRSRGTSSSKRFSVIARGPGAVTIEVAGLRTGRASARVELRG